MAAAEAQETFPKPPELQPDVDFWVSIFTDYDTSEGVLHDNRHLGVVYGKLDIPANTSRRVRNRIVSARRQELQAVLRTLAGGKRDELSAEEARVLALWPDGVSNAELNAAVNRIRFQLGLSDRFRQGLARAGRWRAFVESEFTALGVPVELAALPHVESSYNPNARSHVGASGIWQFTRSTGRRFMQVDHVVDERNDPFAATRGAGKLLAYNYSITGNWPMAITAYNHGLAGVRRAMRQFGDTAYVEILRNYRGRTFGFASRNFYVAFLAAMEVDLNVEKYFPGVTPEQATNYSTMALPSYIAVDNLTRALGVTPAQLAQSNPALQSTVWQGSKHIPKGFDLRIPSASIDGSLASLLGRVPAEQWASEQLPDLFHRVARGDTLSQIAETYKTRVSTLVALNNLSSRHRIRIGQQIRLPAAGPAPVAEAAPPAASVAAVANTDTAAVTTADGGETIAETVTATAETPAEEPPAADAAVAEVTPAAFSDESTQSAGTSVPTALLSDPSDYNVADDLTIEVHPLETLGHYADWLGIRTQRLRDINGLAFRTPVTVGDRIKLEIRDVDVPTFESRRIAYHRAQQDEFFRDNVITGVTEHEIRRGESIWILSLREYDVPVWLFRQYNPTLELHKVRPGTTVRFPVLAAVDRS